MNIFFSFFDVSIVHIEQVNVYCTDRHLEAECDSLIYPLYLDNYPISDLLFLALNKKSISKLSLPSLYCIQYRFFKLVFKLESHIRTPYPSVFSPNARKWGTEKLRTWSFLVTLLTNFRTVLAFIPSENIRKLDVKKGRVG